MASKRLMWGPVEWDPEPDPWADAFPGMLDRAGRLADRRCPDCDQHLISTPCPASTGEETSRG